MYNFSKVTQLLFLFLIANMLIHKHINHYTTALKISAHIYLNSLICTRKHANTHTHAHSRIHTQTHTHAHTPAYTHTYTHIHTYIYKYTYK